MSAALCQVVQVKKEMTTHVCSTQQKNCRVTLLIMFFAFVLLIAFAAAAPLLLAFLCGMLAGGLISILTFGYWLIKR